MMVNRQNIKVSGSFNLVASIVKSARQRRYLAYNLINSTSKKAKVIHLQCIK